MRQAGFRGVGVMRAVTRRGFLAVLIAAGLCGGRGVRRCGRARRLRDGEVRRMAAWAG